MLRQARTWRYAFGLGYVLLPRTCFVGCSKFLAGVSSSGRTTDPDRRHALLCISSGARSIHVSYLGSEGSWGEQDVAQLLYLELFRKVLSLPEAVRVLTPPISLSSCLKKDGGDPGLLEDSDLGWRGVVMLC